MEIGQRVKWISGSKQMHGLWLDRSDDRFDEVMCIKAGTVAVALTCKVPREILQEE
jgi:hypothetical protein